MRLEKVKSKLYTQAQANVHELKIRYPDHDTNSLTSIKSISKSSLNILLILVFFGKMEKNPSSTTPNIYS